MHLIDFSGEFIMVVFYHKSTYKAAVMCHNVFYWLLHLSKDAFFNKKKKELGDVRSSSAPLLLLFPSHYLLSPALMSLSLFKLFIYHFMVLVYLLPCFWASSPVIVF